MFLASVLLARVCLHGQECVRKLASVCVKGRSE